MSRTVFMYHSGLVSTSGIFVLCYLLRVVLFIQALRPAELSANGWLSAAFQFCCLTVNLALVGSRVASLVVLEFSLRLVSSWATTSLPSTSLQILVHSQFSLGCALSCSLRFLHDGAPKRSLNLLLAAGPSLLLAGQCGRLWRHVATLYPLHSSQCSCGICVSLLTSGHTLQAFLCHSLKLSFGVAVIAAISTLNHPFKSASEALRFWTPLTVCYALLVVYVQEEQRRCSSGTAARRTAVVRLGGLLLLVLTVGRWTDVLHVLLCFPGEACCLIPSQDLQALVAQVRKPVFAVVRPSAAARLQVS
uniref:Transmembrane protein 82 n=1 Tax=Scleropages formosus TaxID=113540 RepID=A0A8C9V2R7_SCLFO